MWFLHLCNLLKLETNKRNQKIFLDGKYHTKYSLQLQDKDNRIKLLFQERLSIPSQKII